MPFDSGASADLFKAEQVKPVVKTTLVIHANIDQGEGYFVRRKDNLDNVNAKSYHSLKINGPFKLIRSKVGLPITKTSVWIETDSDIEGVGYLIPLISFGCR